jgi:hypothetical protein
MYSIEQLIVDITLLVYSFVAIGVSYNSRNMNGYMFILVSLVLFVWVKFISFMITGYFNRPVPKKYPSY